MNDHNAYYIKFLQIFDKIIDNLSGICYYVSSLWLKKAITAIMP